MSDTKRDQGGWGNFWDAEWISVEDELPAEKCLTYTPNMKGSLTYRIMPADDVRRAAYVTHWMPLPEPPK